MLKQISPLISPQLLQVLMEMGHGDELVLADGNFPAASHARRLVRADGLPMRPLLQGVLRLLPIDTFVAEVALVMQPVDAQAPEPVIWKDFRQQLHAAEGRTIDLTLLERHAFYERARQAYAVVATGESAHYANLILKKGVLASTE
ncbi:MAG: RbsD/FucU family protein [Planctomycetaceae bacterium]